MSSFVQLSMCISLSRRFPRTHMLYVGIKTISMRVMMNLLNHSDDNIVLVIACDDIATDMQNYSPPLCRVSDIQFDINSHFSF